MQIPNIYFKEHWLHWDLVIKFQTVKPVATARWISIRNKYEVSWNYITKLSQNFLENHSINEEKYTFFLIPNICIKLSSKSMHQEWYRGSHLRKLKRNKWLMTRASHDPLITTHVSVSTEAQFCTHTEWSHSSGPFKLQKMCTIFIIYAEIISRKSLT